MAAEPPTRSSKPVWFLVEDEWGLLKATIFRPIYERYGDLSHHRRRSSWRDG